MRSIPPDTRTPPPPPSYAVGTRGLGITSEASEPKYTRIAAATSKEDAFEHFTEGKDHGALTYFLTRELRSAGAGATYRDVMDAVFGNVTANYPASAPAARGCRGGPACLQGLEQSDPDLCSDIATGQASSSHLTSDRYRGR